MKNNLYRKGFIVPVLLGMVAILIIGGGVYVYKAKKVDAPVVVSDKQVDEGKIVEEVKKVKTTTPSNSTAIQDKSIKTFKLGTLEFSYPNMLTLSKKGEVITLGHSIPWAHENRCAFAAEDKPNLDKIEDFYLSFTLINKNMDDTMKSHTPPYDPANDIEKYQIGSLKGYKVHYNFEACGADQYYFQVSNNETLFLARPFHVQTAPQQRLSELKNILGFITNEKEEQIFKDILSSIKGLENKETMTIKVYFGDTIDAQSCHTPSYVERTIPKTTAVARAALNELLKGPTAEEKLQDRWTGLNSGISIKTLTLNNGIVYVDFSLLANSQFNSQYSVNICKISATLIIKNQIESTLKQFPTVKSVVITVNGKPMEDFFDI